MFVGAGPIGSSWRTWYHDLEQDGDRFTIATTGGGSATFDLNERALVEKNWMGYRKPINLLAGICGIVLAMIALKKRGRRMRLRMKHEVFKKLLLGLAFGIYFLLPVSIVAAYLGANTLRGAAAAKLWIPLYLGCYYLGFCEAGRRMAREAKKGPTR